MSKRAFDKIAAGLNESLAIARGHAKPVRRYVHKPKSPDDPRDEMRDRYQREVTEAVTAALDRGYAATKIGVDLVNDPAFVNKLFTGHRFILTTLVRARSQMHLFAKPREFSVVSPSKVLD